MISRISRRVDALRPVEGKGVEPEGDLVQHRPRLGGIGLDRKEVPPLSWGGGEPGQRGRGPRVKTVPSFGGGPPPADVLRTTKRRTLPRAPTPCSILLRPG